MKTVYINMAGMEPYVPEPKPAPNWEYYMNRKGRYYFRNASGAKCAFTNDSEAAKAYFKGKKYGDEVSLKIEPNKQ